VAGAPRVRAVARGHATGIGMRKTEPTTAHFGRAEVERRGRFGQAGAGLPIGIVVYRPS